MERPVTLPPSARALHAAHASAYRDFFEANDLVVSVAFNFPWGSLGTGHYSRYPRAKSKVGLRCYVGFRAVGREGAALRDITSYDVGRGEFVSGDRLHDEEGRIEETAARLLGEAGFGAGLEMSILSETARGHSFGLSGTSSAGIAAGLHLLAGKVTLKDLADPVEFSHTDKFDALFRQAWEFDFHFRHGNSTGHTAYVALSPWAGPELLITEPFDSNLPHQNLAGVRYRPLSLQERAGAGAAYAGAPADYCMVYAGQPAVPVAQIEGQRMEDFVGIDRRRLVLGKDVLSAAGVDFETYASRLLYGGAAVSAVDDVTVLLNAHTVELFQKFYREGPSDALTEAFLRHVTSYRHITTAFRQSTGFAGDFGYAFRKVRESDAESWGIMPAYLDSAGGGYVVATRPGMSRTTLAAALVEVRRKYPDAAIEYASWEDDAPHEGLRVEQWKTKGVAAPTWIGN